MDDYTLLRGDCLTEMAGMDAGSVDAVVTDPPYHLISSPARKSGFMGKTWDGGYVANDPLTWQAAMRVLKPSHYLLAFGGTRTWHRLACAIEDAGFEIRDTLMWLYGSGFPKGKSCLKPAWEPIILARKPGPMRELGIEECRIATSADDAEAMQRANTPGSGRMKAGGSPIGTFVRSSPTGAMDTSSGRWPANLILDEEAGAMLDGQTGTTVARMSLRGLRGRHDAGDQSNQRIKPYTNTVRGHNDSGGASRFFYCAKSSRSERSAGCEGMDERPGVKQFNEGMEGKTRSNGTVVKPALRQSNTHPTVKPLALMRWLVKLVAQPGDVVLDPFMGSGTTGVACVMEGREFIGIEREAEYVEIARRRIEAAASQTRLPVE